MPITVHSGQWNKNFENSFLFHCVFNCVLGTGVFEEHPQNEPNRPTFMYNTNFLFRFSFINLSLLLVTETRGEREIKSQPIGALSSHFTSTESNCKAASKPAMLDLHNYQMVHNVKLINECVQLVVASGLFIAQFSGLSSRMLLFLSYQTQEDRLPLEPSYTGSY